MSLVDTTTLVDLDSKEGKKLLRRISKRPQYGPKYEYWTCRASADDGWRLKFVRKIEAKKAGDADAYVTIETDYVVRQTGETGRVRPFEDAEYVLVPSAKRLFLWRGESRSVAKLLLDGWHLAIQHSSGSTGSSRHGIATVSLIAESDSSVLTIADTIIAHGSKLCGCSIDF